MNKNTRWALAIVGVVILIVAAVVIGTGGDETTDAVDPGRGATEQTTGPETSPTPPTGATGQDDNGTGGSPGEDSGRSGDGTGGASPQESPGDGDTGGASPGDDGRESGGASTSGFSAAPLLVPGKTRTIEVDKGDTVYLRARSPEADELHIHGYDKTVPLPAGKLVRYKFRANLDGVYEIELHHNGGQVATLKVNP